MSVPAFRNKSSCRRILIHSPELNSNNARTLLYKLMPRVEISDLNEVQVQSIEKCSSA